MGIKPEFNARPKDRKKKPNVPRDIPSTVGKCAEFKETDFFGFETEAKRELCSHRFDSKSRSQKANSKEQNTNFKEQKTKGSQNSGTDPRAVVAEPSRA